MKLFTEMKRVKMKQYPKSIWFFLLSIIVCNSCEYEPSGVYYLPEILVDNTVEIWTKTEVVNGYLKISWENCRAKTFKEYVIRRYIGNSNEEISRVLTNEFVDNAYVGEGGKYFIYINDIYDNQTYWGELELEREFPVIGFKAVENNLYHPYWHKSKYYGAIDKYEVRVELSSEGKEYYKISQNANDSIFESVSAPFADYATITLSLVPVNANSFYHHSDHFFTIQGRFMVGNYITDETLHFCHILQVDQNGFSFIDGCDTLLRYSFDQKKVIQRMGYLPHPECFGCTFSSTSVSSSGKSFTANIACWDDVLMINSEKLSDYKAHDLKQYSGQFYSPDIPVSDIGLAVVNSIDGSFYIYDFNSETAVRYPPEDTYSNGHKISPNGKYLFISDNGFKLVKYENGLFTKIDCSEPVFYEFDPLNPNQVFAWDRSSFSIRSIDDFSVIRQFELSDESISSIDFHQEEILTQNAGHLYVRSLLTGEILKDIPAPNNSRCFLINRTLLSENGIIHYIN